MNTSQIKNFAIESRNILKAGVIRKIQALGFDAEGHPMVGLPEKISGGTIFNNELHSESFYSQWMSLYEHIQRKGIKEVYEEAAYTWFNRLVAIRIMQKNNFIDPVLEYTDDVARIPRIVAEARKGRMMCELSAYDKEKLYELLQDDTKTNEQFALLVENFCKENPVIFNCFGGIEKYTSLLLPDNILAKDGFIDLLNQSSYITDEDYTKSELIGWLYQFYISEKKDEVFESFKHGNKAEAEDIPAATQIFTPNWIVKYMAQNTLGRIYLDNHPYSDLGSGMKYLVGEKTPDEAVLKLNELPEYKVIDPACGSGHILVEAFDLLYSMYLEEGYSSREALEFILTKNLTGIDLDTRAKQLSTFALLMKAARIDRKFLDCKIMPRVMDMPKPYSEWSDKPINEFLEFFFAGKDEQIFEECEKSFELLKQADNLGSIMKFNMISDRTRWAIEKRIEEWKAADATPFYIKQSYPSFELILALTDKYISVVANPPYMGSGNMNNKLKLYVNNNFALGKADLFAVFMIHGINILCQNGKLGMINMQNWMFISTYEPLRKHFLDKYNFDSFLHLGPRTFDELSGEVVQNASFIISNHAPVKGCVFYRLIEGRNCSQKEEMFLSNTNVYNDISQNSFKKIPGSPIAYWVSDKIKELFSNELFDKHAFSDGKNVTGDNDKYLRYIWEVSSRRIGKGKKWMLQAKGGEARKWYGNTQNVIAWSPQDIEFYHKNKISRVIKEYLWYKEGITWSKICSSTPTFRYLREDTTYDEVNITPNNQNELYSLLGALNSKVVTYLLDIINPTLSVQTENALNMPFSSSDEIDSLTKNCLSISREDWDAHETSWDFKKNELIRMKDNCGGNVADIDMLDPEEAKEIIAKYKVPTDSGLISDCISAYKSEWARKFHRLHANEEEINRKFIKLYDLKDEFTPDVPFNEVTILQEGEITIENNQIVWHEDVLLKHFISYAIGCMMGRYRLDKPGLHIAYPNPSADDIASYACYGGTFDIDDDGIIPLLNRDCPFVDNAYDRLVQFIGFVFGQENLNKNLNYIESHLGCSLEKYLIKDFWKVHKKMYQNKPIYWLFSSKRGAFQVITYMHRMNKFTAEAIRTKYLLPYIENLQATITQWNDSYSSLSAGDRRKLDNMVKALDECREYEEILHDVAQQAIEFDLDDGVTVNYAKFGNVVAKIR